MIRALPFAVAAILAALSAPLEAQEVTVGQAGADCVGMFVPSAATTGDVPIDLTNGTDQNLFVAWMNFAGNAIILDNIAPGQSFRAVSRPQHVYVVMDGNLNCLYTVRLGPIGHSDVLR